MAKADLPEMIPALAEIASSVARDLAGITPEVAEAAGWEIAERFVRDWGGQQVYVPKADSIARGRLYEAVWQEFRGDNHAEIARRHGISTVWVYAIVKRMRAAHRARTQREIFG